MKSAIALAFLLSSAGPASAEQLCETRLTDSSRGGREVPIRIRLPNGNGKVPVVLFSHGLGGSLDAGERWAQAWAVAGIATVHLQHPGSDAALWRGLSGLQAMQALRSGMTTEQFVARVADVRFVLDRIASGGAAGPCSLDRLDMTRVGMAGHSFGAQTTQAIAGQTFVTRTGQATLTDRRVKAAIAFSPAPAANVADDIAFGGITIPFLSVTGSEDASPVMNRVTPADRQRPFRAMPPGGKYLLVLGGADHMILAGGDIRRSRSANDRRVEAIAVDATTDFWRATLIAPSRRVEKPASLGPSDIWQAR